MDIDIILDAIHDDILISDGAGRVVKVSPTFESVYGIKKEEALGLTVYELEEKGFFRPSVTAQVLKSGEKITMRQKNNSNRDIVVTATPVKDEYGNIKYVVSFSRDITDYLILQEQYEELEDKVSRYQDELVLLRSESAGTVDFIAKSDVMNKLLVLVNRIAPFDANVLLTGESGVGKSFMAKLIHRKSKRAQGPFIDINCGAIPENLLESELFGYEKGSFTGAGKDGKVGLIELAQNGTLFLDEISELPLGLQVKILKVIQDKTIIRVGGTRQIPIDFRLISASNKNLLELMKSEAFREDLYYRLNVISLHIPPLREREEDLIPLIAHFVDKTNKTYGFKKMLSKETYNVLTTLQWPGNIRELENTIEKILLTSETNIISLTEIRSYSSASNLTPTNLNEALDALESKLVSESYKRHGTTVGVAHELGISQPTAHRKITKYCHVFTNE